MRLEFLPDIIALALDRFAIGGRDPGKGVEPGVDGRDERVAMVKVTCFAGAEIAVAIGVGDGGGATLGVDSLDQRGAILRGEKIAQDEQGQFLVRHALHAGMCADPCGIAVGGGGDGLVRHGRSCNGGRMR